MRHSGTDDTGEIHRLLADLHDDEPSGQHSAVPQNRGGAPVPARHAAPESAAATGAHSAEPEPTPYARHAAPEPDAAPVARHSAEPEPTAAPAPVARPAPEPVAEPTISRGIHRRDERIRLELRVVRMVVRRELIRYLRSRAKILASLVQPFFFLLVFGIGMRNLVPASGGVSFEAFVFPGVLAMTVLGRALLSAVTIVQDREYGFLREMLVSPASRLTIVFGAIAGGATVSTIQAIPLLAGAPIMGLRPGPGTIAAAIGMLAVLAVEVTALGVALATFISRPQSFSAVTQALMYPMLILSGALVPLTGLPGWVQSIAKLNIFAYPVDAIRRLLLADAAHGSFVGLVVLGHHLSILDEVAVTGGLTVLFGLIAGARFARVS